MSVLEIGGRLRKRYILAATLLSLLDPVRGDPTAYNLDHESHRLLDPLDRILKRKFLDSFALICAFQKRTSDSVSAACLDRDNRDGTVVRIASNGGVPENVMAGLREILAYLSRMATAEAGDHETPTANEVDLLYMIIKLNISKIRDYLLDLSKSRAILEERAEGLQARLTLLLPHASPKSIQEFCDWFTTCFLIPDVVLSLDVRKLFAWVRWAEKARQFYVDFLRAAFTNKKNLFHKWVSYVFKLGRCANAAKVFVRSVTEIPSMFSIITVEAITAPQSAIFGFPDNEQPLISVLRRVPEIKPDEVFEKLAVFWGTRDPEGHLRRKCSKHLASHAELQVVSFYDENPQLKPECRYIGVSKKSCYLCYYFLAHHHGGFVVSSCHQKMYLSIPPPAKTLKVSQQWKSTTTLLCIRMEGMIREELTERFRLKREVYPPDSTAGGSLADSMEWKAWQTIELEELPDLVDKDRDDSVDVGARLYYEHTHEKYPDSSSRTVTPKIAASITLTDPANLNPQMRGQNSNLSDLFSSIVLHVRTPEDKLNQDLISVQSILDSTSNLPSWSRLVDILSLSDSVQLNFNSTDYLMLNGRIRIQNQRQFLASLQYTINSGTLNADVIIGRI